MYDIIIIGAGPAGMTAALYAKQARKNILLFVSYIALYNISKGSLWYSVDTKSISVIGLIISLRWASSEKLPFTNNLS